MLAQELAALLLEKFRLALEQVRANQHFEEFAGKLWEVSSVSTGHTPAGGGPRAMAPTGRIIVACNSREALDIFVAAIRAEGHQVLPMLDRIGVTVTPAPPQSS